MPQVHNLRVYLTGRPHPRLCLPVHRRKKVGLRPLRARRAAEDPSTHPRSGTGDPATGPPETCGVLQDQWLDAKRRKLGNGALRYEELIRLHIVLRVGNRWLDSLRPLDVQKLYADLEDGGLSTATVLKVHTVMHGRCGRQ